MTDSRRILIIGAGPGGLAMAIKARQAGFDDITILEKGSGVGGTWYHNRYPGAACDIPSVLYSYSFAPKLDWSRPYAGQAEIKAYFEHCAESYGLVPLIRFDTMVTRLIWDDTSSTWRAETGDGEVFESDIVVSAVGMFNEPRWPTIDGLDRFHGEIFHSARWPHDRDVSGQRVAVIGSGASAVQAVPVLAASATHLSMFQRSPQWITLRDDDPYTPEQIAEFRADPDGCAARRKLLAEQIDVNLTFSNPAARAYAEQSARAALDQVVDPELRARLTPTDPYGCHRPLVSNTYYPAFNRPNVELVTEPIIAIDERGIRTADGEHRAFDVILCATGFHTIDYLSVMPVTGRDGALLTDAWADGAQAYLGVSVAGFPNLFMLYGPNTNNGSILHMIECQVGYIVRHLDRMRREHLSSIAISEEAMAEYNEEIQRRLDGVAVWNAGCSTYYRSPSGRIVTQWPGNMASYAEATAVEDSGWYISR